jgi:lysophospholipase L1-like esterase
VIRAVRKAAGAAGVDYIGFPDPLRHHPELMTDNAHPNDAGYAAIAAALDKHLARFLPKS